VSKQKCPNSLTDCEKMRILEGNATSSVVLAPRALFLLQNGEKGGLGMPDGRWGCLVRLSCPQIPADNRPMCVFEGGTPHRVGTSEI
jgi:hypothetical protein